MSDNVTVSNLPTSINTDIPVRTLDKGGEQVQVMTVDWGGQITTTAPKGDTSAGSYTAPSISGRIGLVTGGINGNAAMTSGTQNPPYLVINYIIKAT